MTPRATKGPPRIAVFLNVTKYSGMKTLKSPNAISWKKNPSRHIANALFQRCIKTFTLNNQKLQSFVCKKPSLLINAYEAAHGEISRKTLLFFKSNQEQTKEAKNTEQKCPECGSQRNYKDGIRQTKSGEIQRYLCRDCCYRFSA